MRGLQAVLFLGCEPSDRRVGPCGRGGRNRELVAHPILGGDRATILCRGEKPDYGSASRKLRNLSARETQVLQLVALLFILGVVLRFLF